MPADRIRATIIDRDNCDLGLTVNADGSINVAFSSTPTALVQNSNQNESVTAAGSTTILAANANRNGLILYNFGDAAVSINFAAVAATTGMFRLAAGVGYTQPEPSGFVYQGEIRAIAVTAPTTTPNVSVVEWT